MRKCPYCGYSNYDNATVCRKCDGSFVLEHRTLDQGRTFWMGPERARHIRRRALSMIVLGLLIKVYWGGYGPWPTVDYPILVTLRVYLEPLLLGGGALVYVMGWILAFV
jgi:hypothetical protein